MERRALLSLALCLAGCQGVISGLGGDAPDVDDVDDGEHGFAPPSASDAVGHDHAADGVRRLTHREYDRSVRALFGDDLEYRSSLAPDAHVFGYDRVAEGLTVSPQHIDGYASTASEVAAAVIRDAERVGRWMDCGAVLPPRARTRDYVQEGEDLTCSYSANCYRPMGAVSYPNRRPNGTEPGYINYEQSVPALGRYRLTLRARLDAPYAGARLELRHGSYGVLGSFALSGETYEDLSVEFEVPEAGPLPLTIHWVEPLITPGIRVYVDTVTMTGPIAPAGGASAAELRGCAEGLVDALGPRAFRRPLAEAERALLLRAYDAGAEEHFWDGVRMVLEVILQSPQFLYLVEVGAPVADAPGFYRLDGFELATRLSFLLWEAPPDDELWAAAASGSLETDGGLRAQAERLLSDPRARSTVQRFYEQWLQLDEVMHAERSATLFPELTQELREAMVEEVRRFMDDGIWDSGASLEELLTAEESFVDAQLADLYGLPAPGEDFAQVTLPPERRGLLTLPALLMARSQSNQTSPVQRGIFVLEQLLCIELPSPPENVDVNPPSVETEAPTTTRERWAQHSSNPTCRSCHSHIDPVGFTFEAFDPIGRFRTEESGRPIDTAGGIPSVGIDDGAIADAAELAYTLAALPETRDCFARQWLRFGLGRLERDVDAEDLQVLARLAEEGSVRQMLLALIDTTAFRHRIVEEEVER